MSDSTDRKAPPPPNPNVVEGHRLVDKKEKFVVDKGEPAESAASTPAKCVICDDEFEDGDTSIFDADLGGNVHVDCLETPDPEDVKVEPPPIHDLSEAELVLQSEAPQDDYWLLIDRLPMWETEHRADTRATTEYCDEIRPVTLHYREQIRKKHGPGHYLCRMFKRGQGLAKGGMWKITISATAAAGNNRGAAAQESGPAPDRKTLLKEELQGIAETGKLIREVFFDASPRRIADPPPLPAPDPEAALTKSFDLVSTVIALGDRLRPPAPPPSTNTPIVEGGERTWVDGVERIFNTVANAPIVQQMFAPVAGAWLNDWYQESKAKRLAQSQNAIGGGAGSTPGAGVGGNAPPSGPQPPNVSRETSPPPNPATAVSPQVKELLLKPIVSDMLDQVANCEDGEPYNPEASVNLTLQLLEMAGDEGIVFLREHVLLRSGLQMVMWLSSLDPEWAIIPGLPDAINYATYCEAYRDELREALAERQAAKQEAGTSPQPAGPSGSVPPAVAGGPNGPKAEPPDLHIVSDVSRETSPASDADR